MRWVELRRAQLAALVVVACSAPTRAPEPQEPAAPDEEREPQKTGASEPQEPAVLNCALEPIEPSVTPTPIPTTQAKRDALAMPHGGTIVLLALSPDGEIALTADEFGGVRLWPSLDGKHEPVVVDMPEPKELAVGRFAGGIMAVARDEAGGLYVAKLDDSGNQLSHETVHSEPRVVGMAMTSLGLLAWRADQTIALIDANGAVKRRLATGPDQRIITLGVNGKHAVALLENGTTRTREARWLTLEPSLAWGKWIHADSYIARAIDIAVSPNGKRLAVLAVPPSLNVTTGLVFDLATNKTFAIDVQFTTPAEIGFADDDYLVLDGFSVMLWVDVTVDKPAMLPVSSAPHGVRAEAMLGTGGGRSVSPTNGDLVIRTLTETKYLGYDPFEPLAAAVGPHGQLLAAFDDQLMLLDKNLAVNATITPGGKSPRIAGQIAELSWLGEDDWLVQTRMPDNTWGPITLVDSTRFSKVVRKGVESFQLVAYEPSTQLVTLTAMSGEAEVARVDRKAHELVSVASVAPAKRNSYMSLLPVSPSLSNGTQLIETRAEPPSMTRWLRDPRALDKPSAMVTVDGTFQTADAAGHVYMWCYTPTRDRVLVLFADGKPLHALPNTGVVRPIPDPDGKRYIALASKSVSLHDLDGKQLWSRWAESTRDVLWLTDGALAIVSGGGVARLDPATGVFTAARCGWHFALANKPHALLRSQPLCLDLQRSP